ncbi:solute carrier family 35 member F5-like isoform X2 [Penaeus japonicus]|uniref:solute carrier family 35 member F5-like isoform X2 n=1 Tax=Penaeus japonicus TaxID=27405 RepID=UPI001C7138FC|nr:solute carrier family 35 member F5-like isoform X2 [Penaeus japonicus]
MTNLINLLINYNRGLNSVLIILSSVFVIFTITDTSDKAGLLKIDVLYRLGEFFSSFCIHIKFWYAIDVLRFREWSNMGRGQRMALGIFVLLLVDVIWVASSELSEYIFNDAGFDKPFFSTYLKTSMFTLYLLGFVFWSPWRHQCIHSNQDESMYQVVDIGDSEELATPEERRLSEPKYVPLKLQDQQEKSSDGESDDSSVKSVRFSKLTEVRQMSESEAVEAMMSRLSFSASLRAEQLALQAANKLSIKEVMKISCIFCLLWFLGNYGYQIALSDTEAGVVNVISSTSGLFTLILAAVFPSSSADKFTLSKLFSVLLMVAGVVLVSLEDISLEGATVPVGVVWALVGAVLYACYMVFLRRKVPTEDRMDFSMFFGFVGLFNTIILWPGFPLLDVLGWETFQLPNKQQLLYMSVNGLIGTVLSELLWLWGCFLTSSLMATLSLSLTIPLTMVVDIFVKDVKYSLIFYIGAIPMMLSFIIVTLLTHYENWDPLMDCITKINRRCSRNNHMYSLVDTEGVERESLIVNETGLDEVEDEDEEEVDTTCINNAIIITDNTSASNSLPTTINNII